MSKAAVFFMAFASFLAGLFIGSRFLPSNGNIGCGNKINWYITKPSDVKNS